MSDGDQEITYIVPDAVKKEVVVSILKGEKLGEENQPKDVKALLSEEGRKNLTSTEGPLQYLQELKEGKIALTSEAIRGSIEQKVQEIEEREDITQKRKEVTQFADGLVLLRRMSENDRRRFINIVIRGGKDKDAKWVDSMREKYGFEDDEWENRIYPSITSFLDRSVRDLSDTNFVIELANRQGKSPEEMAKEIVIANFSEGRVLQHIETSLADALTEDIDYSELRQLEEEKKRLSREIKDYENRVNQLKQEIQEANKVARERGGSLLNKERNIDSEWIKGQVETLEEEIKKLQGELQEEQKRLVAGGDNGNAQQEISTIEDDIKEIERQRDLLLNFEDNVEELVRLQSKEMIDDIGKKEERLQQVEGELKDKREQVKRKREEYIEGVYRSSVKGLGEYAQEVNNAIAEVDLSQEEKVIRRRILEKVRDRLKINKEMHNEVLNVLFDSNKKFEERVETILRMLLIDERILLIGNLRGIYREMMGNGEFKERLLCDVATEALAQIVFKDPNALKGALDRNTAEILAFQDDVLLKIINSAQQRVNEAQEKLRELEEMGLIKKGFGERVGETLEALGKGIRERKFVTAGAIIGIILVLILLGILPPLAAWPGIASSAAEGLGEKIIGH